MKKIQGLQAPHGATSKDSRFGRIAALYGDRGLAAQIYSSGETIES